MAAPGCRDCEGSGAVLDIPHYGESANCPRCDGEGVEACGECLVTDPRRLVVAEYNDRCADGLRPYDSQVCEACARRLRGLIEGYTTPADLEETCAHCGFAEKGAGWGYLTGPRWSGPYCEHFSAQRHCSSCTEDWWRPGLVYDWDIDGCAHEDCPDCVAWAASPEGVAELARRRETAVAP